MKLVTLNIWGAQVREPFIEFIQAHKDVDIFCLQEVYDKAEEKLTSHYPRVSRSIFTELCAMLPEHEGYFRPVVDGVYGIAIFIKKNLLVTEEGEVVIHKNTKYDESSGHHSRNLQWITFEYEGKTYTVINVHGLWNGMGKTDTPDRITQSTNIRSFMDRVSGPMVVCGDFNLRPDTESMKILEEGMRNLITEYGVQSTRTSIYGKEEQFADYVFVNADVVVSDFKVLPDEVSDHSPLFLNFT